MKDNAPLAEFCDRLLDAVAAGSFVALTLRKPSASAGDVKSIDIRPILVKRALKLSVTTHHRTKDVVKNYPAHEVAQMLGAELCVQFAQAQLMSTQGDVTLQRADGQFTLAQHAASQTTAPTLSHDRAKNRLIDSHNKPYLHALGIADANGAVYKNAQDKFRQINKYIEIVDGLLRQLPARDTLRIVDMGAGKGYLTFALYDYVCHTLKQKVEITGVEFRPDLVEKCNAIATAAGFSGLRFEQGSIADYDCRNADMVIALHACDTATDDAIAKAIHAGAAIIVVAPCCHKQVRRAMGEVPAHNPLGFLLAHGTYVERISEMVTDGLRAQWMELYGYRSKLFEFISDVHTPKNVMIVGIKSAVPLSAKAAEALRQSIAQSKAQFGIGHHQLERLLEPQA